MNSAEIREKFQKFFEDRGHKRIPSSSLIPEGDSTTLFTSSGMQPLVPFLLGQKHPAGDKLVNSQKSFRAEDIDEVGDNRHTTFFEMLGNWSLGSYWKKEQLGWLFEFLTKELGMDPNRLYVTVFSGDDENGIEEDKESIEIWQNLFKIAGISAKHYAYKTMEKAYECGIRDNERIFGYGVDKNWWSRSGKPKDMPIGEPGGPDSEVFYKFDVTHDPKFGEKCHVNCDCGQFMEIGNSVFMEYLKTEKGFEKLKQRNVDFGGGLERLSAAANNDSNVFNIDLLKPLIDMLPATVKRKAKQIITDHFRASVFLIADGVTPSNKEEGYIVRRLLRRAFLYAKRSNIKDDGPRDFISTIIDLYRDYYPNLAKSKDEIISVIYEERKKFIANLEGGITALKKIYGSAVKNADPDNLPEGLVLEGNTIRIKGKQIFDIYQTFGIPIEVSQELMQDWGISFDDQTMQEAAVEMKKHQELSRTASAGQFKGGLASHSDKVVRLHTATHLMNAALRKILGEHVYQKGSNITEERTRFDFTHGEKMTAEQKQQVEEMVNNWVKADLGVKKENMPIDEAKKLGAIGVFGEKYADTVSIYTIYDSKTDEVVSREFCGGPHVERTGTIGNFKIQKEEAVSAGVRRIKAIVE